MTSIELRRGPAYHLLPKEASKRSENPMPVRGDTRSQSRNLNEEVRSVTPERHYDKSQRSARSQSRDGNSQNNERQSGHSERNHSQHADDRSQRSGSVRSTDNVSVHYRKVSSSLVSNPDNLVCDDCINKKIGEGHREKAKNQREIDKEHALKTNANLKKQLEEEKEKHLEKLRLYREGIRGQNDDQIAKKALQREAEENEKERIKRQMADNSDLIALQKKAQDALLKYRDDLDDQLANNEEARAQKERERIERDKKTHNLVIDDGWRAPHRKALVNHYKDNLLNQLDDNARDRLNKKRAQEEADANYMNGVIAYNQKDRAQKEAIEAEKKDLLKNELDKQLLELAEKRRDNADLKNDDDEKFRQKIAQDNQVFLDNEDRKRKLVQGFLDNLHGQMKDKEEEKRNALIESKKAQGTGLHIPGKVNKCYNCAICRRIMALQRLNKRYEVARSRSKAKRLEKTQ